MAAQAVDLAPLRRRVDQVEGRLEVLERQPAADAIGPNTFMTIDSEGVVTEAEGPEGPEGPEGEEGPEGPEGEEGPEGPEGKEGPEGGSKPRGTMQITPLAIPIGGGTAVEFLVAQAFQPVACLLLTVTNGPVATEPSTAGGCKFSGWTLSKTSSENSGLRPSISLYMTGTVGGVHPLFGPGPGPRNLLIQRSAECNAKNETLIWLITFSLGQPVVSSGGTAGNKETGTTLEQAAVATTFNTEMHSCIFSRGVTGLPTARSDTKVVEGTAQYAAGTGAFGLQVQLPSEAERKAATAHTFTWTFPEAAAVAQRAAYGNRYLTA